MATFIVGATIIGIAAISIGLINANNTVNDITFGTINNFTYSTNNATQACVIPSNSIFEAVIGKGSFTTQENWNKFLIIDRECLQEQDTRTNVLRNTNNISRPIANSTIVQWKLPSTVAKNVTTIDSNLGVQSGNTFNKTCNNSGARVQLFRTNQNKYILCNVYNNWEQYNFEATTCLNSDVNINATLNDLHDEVNDSAVTTVRNYYLVMFGIVFFVVAAIATIIFLVLYLNKNKKARVMD